MYRYFFACLWDCSVDISVITAKEIASFDSVILSNFAVVVLVSVSDDFSVAIGETVFVLLMDVVLSMAVNSVVIDSYEGCGDSVGIVIYLVVLEEAFAKELSSLLAVVRIASVFGFEGDNVLGVPNLDNVELLMMFNVVKKLFFNK